jgi:hypothetical protein
MISTNQAQSQSEKHSGRLTITEVRVTPEPMLGGTRIYLSAALGMVFGVLAGVGVAMLPGLRGWAGPKIGVVHAKTIAASEARQPVKVLGMLASSVESAKSDPGTDAASKLASAAPPPHSGLDAQPDGAKSGHLAQGGAR